jgi:hypothetical protein
MGGLLALGPGRKAAAPLPKTAETLPSGVERRLLLLFYLAEEATSKLKPPVPAPALGASAKPFFSLFCLAAFY